MKTRLVIAALLLCTSQVFADDSFDHWGTNKIVRVIVGKSAPFPDDRGLTSPFESEPGQHSPPEFEQYFELHDAPAVSNLVALVRMMKNDHNLGYPFIGTLSEQKFMDSASNVVFSTTIVNYKSTVVINSSPAAGPDYSRTGRSEEFCRKIYELMTKHCPREIEEQDKSYREMNETLAGLLFGKKDK